VKTFYLRVADEEGALQMSTEWSVNDEVSVDNPEFKALLDRYTAMFSGLDITVTIQLFDLSTPTHSYIIKEESE
jgi:hypothetical protein